MIVGVLKNALKLGAKAAKRSAKFVSNSKLGKYVKSTSKSLAKKMTKALTSKKWWGRAVRVMRSNKGAIGAIGKLGKALSKAGGGLGWLGRGLGAFDIDFRSPKEFKKDVKEKEETLLRLKAGRDKLIEKEKTAQEELKNEVIDISNLSTSEEKLDELSNHLQKMKSSLGTIHSNTTGTDMRLKGFEDYQMEANKALSETIVTGDQTAMKATLKGIEETKDATAAATMESTSTVISEISGKIDAIEDARKEEDALRRKNDWKRKFLNGILFLADWILNWPLKLGIMAAKLVAVLLLAFSGEIMKVWKGLEAVFSLGWKSIVKVLALKWAGMLSTMYSKILKAINWLLNKIDEAFIGAKHWLIQSIFDLLKPILDYVGLAEEGQEIIDKWRRDDETKSANSSNKIDEMIDNANKLIQSFVEKNTKDDIAQGYQNIKDQKAEELAEAVAKEKKEKKDAMEKAKNEPSMATKIGNFAGDLVNKGEEIAEVGKEKLKEVADTSIAQKVKSKAVEVKNSIATTAKSGKIEKAIGNSIEDGIDSIKKSNEEMKSEMKDMKKAYNTTRSESSGGTVTKTGDVIDFDSASQQFQNQNQT